MWDELDDNRERRERYHEIRCAEVPVNRISAQNGMIFPRWLMQSDVRQVQRGEFLDVIFDCPFLMHELVTDDALAKTIYDLKDVHKLLLFFLAVRQARHATAGAGTIEKHHAAHAGRHVRRPAEKRTL